LNYSNQGKDGDLSELTINLNRSDPSGEEWATAWIRKPGVPSHPRRVNSLVHPVETDADCETKKPDLALAASIPKVMENSRYEMMVTIIGLRSNTLMVRSSF
jgi:hypothetical protein